MKKKKIVFITTNRADYNIQKEIINKLAKYKKNLLYLIISGTHLSKKFGYTKSDLKVANLNTIDIKNLTKNDKRESALNSISNGIKKYKKILKKISPDMVVLIGDRYEILPVAICCLILKIKIAHIHGGETTAGSFDEQIRHSISKMSNIHFVTHKKYKNRLIQMGEDKSKIFNYGSPSLDYIKNSKIVDINLLCRIFNFNFKKNFFLVCFHSATNDNSNSVKNLKILLNSIKKIKNMNFVFTYPNPDPDFFQIIKTLKKFIKINKKKYTLIKNFGSEYFYSVIKYSKGMIGNSSSGIIEVPIFKLPSINLGNRQEGRELSKSVINCKFNENEIIKKIKYSLTKKFKNSIKKSNSIFYKPKTSVKVAKKIQTEVSKKIFIKKFKDLNL